MLNPEKIFHAKILVVDDCEDTLELVSNSLALSGYTQVSTTNDPTQVRILHAMQRYDLILLDMQMPRMDGLEVIESLRDLEPQGYLPVMAISGDVRYKLTALKAGSRDFVHKPYDHEELQQRVHHLLEVRLQYKDLSDQNQRHEQLALHDPLTHLPNRRLLLDRIENAIERANRDKNIIGLFFLDLDGFKQINDIHGHPFGDLLLKTVAQRLVHIARKQDTVARIGGDEFIMLLSGINDPSEAMRPAAHALTLLSQPYKINDIAVKLSASIGVAFYPNDGHDSESLLSYADGCLYDAKRRGKNCFHSSNKIPPFCNDSLETPIRD